MIPSIDDHAALNWILQVSAKQWSHTEWTKQIIDIMYFKCGTNQR